MKKEKRGIIFVTLSIFFLFVFFSLTLIDAATYTCNSCNSCSAYLTNATTVSGDTIQLSTPISGISGTCIQIANKQNITFDCQNNYLIGTGDSSYAGIQMGNTDNTKLNNCNLSSFGTYGLQVMSGNNNTLTNITSKNSSFGIAIRGFNITLKNIVSDSNLYGLDFAALNSSLDRGNFSGNSFTGIQIIGPNNLLTNIISKENGYDDIESSGFDKSYCNNLLINITGSGSRPIGYYNYSVSLQNQTFSELILCNADGSTLNNITIHGSNSIKNNMLKVDLTNNSIFSNINSSGNSNGISESSSNNNQFSNLTLNNNGGYGFVISSDSSANISDSQIKENVVYDLFATCNNNYFSNLIGSGNRPIGYYNTPNLNLANQAFSELILCGVNNSIINNITLAGSDTLQNNALFIMKSQNVTLSNINSSGNHEGIYVYYDTDNNNFGDLRLVNITANNNLYGFLLTFPNPADLLPNSFNNLIANGNNYSGIYAQGVCSSTFSNITANNNLNGINFQQEDINNSLNILNATNNLQSGIVLLADYNNTITDASLTGNLYGISLQGDSNGNLMRDSYMQGNTVGIRFDDSGYYLAHDNSFYNNYFNNSANYIYDNSYFLMTSLTNLFNTTLISGTNILGDPNLGGNYWATPNGTGFSQTCADANLDGICDSAYNLSDEVNYDFLPLTILPFIAGTGNNSSGTQTSNNGGETTLTNNSNQSGPIIHFFLFDSSLITLNRDYQVFQDRPLQTLVTLVSLGRDLPNNVTLNYEIKGANGKVFLIKNETISVQAHESLKRNLDTGNLPLGDYILELEVIYPQGVAPSSVNFSVVKSSEEFLNQLSQIILVLAAEVALALVIALINYFSKSAMNKADNSKFIKQ